MTARIVPLALALLGASCSIDLDALRFACGADEDCARGTRCDPVVGYCRAPGALTDAGVVDGGATADAGPARIEPGCSPSIETSSGAERWWCRGLSGRELRAFTDRVGAKVLDLEPELLVGAEERRFSAALERKSDGDPADWTDETTSSGSSAFFSRGLQYARIKMLPGAEPRFAATFEGGTGAWFYGFSATSDTIVDKLRRTLVDFRWDPAVFTARVVDLDAWSGASRDKLSWAFRVRGPQRGSTLHFALTVPEVQALAVERKLLDVEPNEVPGLFTVVTATRAREDLAQRFEGLLDVAGIDALLASSRGHVERLVPAPDGSARWWVTVVRTATGVEAQLAARLVDRSDGAPISLLADVAGSTRAAARADRRLRAGPLRATPLVLSALSAVQAGARTLDDEIPGFGRDGAGCPSEPSSELLALGLAIEGALGGDVAAIAALESALGRDAVLADARAAGARRTTLGGVLGCADDAALTTAADQLRLLRALARLDDERREWLYARMPGARPDPAEEAWARESWESGPVIAELLAEEALRAGLSGARLARFSAALRVRYLRGVGGAREGVHDKLMLAVAEVPVCRAGRVEHEPWLWAVGLAEASFHIDSERGLAAVRAELLRTPVRAAMRGFACD